MSHQNVPWHVVFHVRELTTGFCELACIDEVINVKRDDSIMNNPSFGFHQQSYESYIADINKYDSSYVERNEKAARAQRVKKQDAQRQIKEAEKEIARLKAIINDIPKRKAKRINR